MLSRGAAKRADAYVRAADMSEFKEDADHTLQMMGKVEKTLDKATKMYGVGTKVAYALGGTERARACVMGAAAAVAGVMGAHGAEPMMAASLILGGIGYMLWRLIFGQSFPAKTLGITGGIGIILLVFVLIMTASALSGYLPKIAALFA